MRIKIINSSEFVKGIDLETVFLSPYERFRRKIIMLVKDVVRELRRENKKMTATKPLTFFQWLIVIFILCPVAIVLWIKEKFQKKES